MSRADARGGVVIAVVVSGRAQHSV